MKIKVKVLILGKGGVIEYNFKMSITGEEKNWVVDRAESYVEDYFPAGTKIVSIDEIDGDNILNG